MADMFKVGALLNDDHKLLACSLMAQTGKAAGFRVGSVLNHVTDRRHVQGGFAAQASSQAVCMLTFCALLLQLGSFDSLYWHCHATGISP